MAYGFDDFDQDARDEEGAALGDPRRCPHHPHVATSSPDGLFDAPCGECEAAIDEDAAREAFEQEQVADALAAMATPEWQAEAARRAALTPAERAAEQLARAAAYQAEVEALKAKARESFPSAFPESETPRSEAEVLESGDWRFNDDIPF